MYKFIITIKRVQQREFSDGVGVGVDDDDGVGIGDGVGDNDVVDVGVGYVGDGDGVGYDDVVGVGCFVHLLLVQAHPPRPFFIFEKFLELHFKRYLTLKYHKGTLDGQEK